MQNKGVTIIIAAAVIAVFGIGGYYVGTRSAGNKGVAAQGVQRSANESVSQAVGTSAMIDDLNAKVSASPRDTELLSRLADAYFDKKQFDEAVKYYKKVIELKPDDASTYNEIGLSLHYQGKSAEGVRYIDEGIKKNPYFQKIWLTKGFILAYGMGDLSAAKEAWEKTKALNPESNEGKAAADYLSHMAVAKK